MNRSGIGLGPYKMALFQAFGQQAHAIAAPPQHLDAVTFAPTKDKHMTTEWILLQDVLGNGGQPDAGSCG